MAAKLIPLVCNHCGAPLQVPADVRFVTCSHCNTSLAVEHEGDVHFTRQLEQLADATDRIDSKLASVENQLKRQTLDLQWESDQKKLMVRRKDGDLQIPKRLDSTAGLLGMVLGMAVLFGFGIFAASIGNGSGPGGVFVIFLVVAGIAMFFGAMSEHQKAVRYESAKRRYQNARAKLSDDDRPFDPNFDA